MNKLSFLIQGSSNDPYQVTFTKEGSNLTAHCTCPAGDKRMACKHRLNLLAGHVEGCITGQEGIPSLLEWVKDTDVDQALSRLQQMETELEQAKKGVTAAKRQLANALND